MSVLTATIAKGLAFFTGSSSFRTHDDSSDNKVSGVYSHNAIEFSATEADEWASWMMYINSLMNAGIGTIVARNESGGTFLKGTLVYISGVNALVEAGDAAAQLSSWVLNGITLANTNNMQLYWALSNSGSDRTINLYSDPGMTVLVATGTRNGDGSITITDGGSGSGISGSVTVAYTVDDSDAANILSLNVPLLSKADPTDVTKVPCYVLDADLATDTTGTAYSFRRVSGVDTSGYAAVGSKVYASATPGAITPTAPTTCDQCFVGIVTEKHATTGSILFFPGLRLVEKFGARTFQAQATFNANVAYGSAATFGTNAAGGVSSYSNAMVAPTTSPADVAQVYCADFAAGDARMYARYESMSAGSPIAVLGLAQSFTAVQTFTAAGEAVVIQSASAGLKINATSNDPQVIFYENGTVRSYFYYSTTPNSLTIRAEESGSTIDFWASGASKLILDASGNLLFNAASTPTSSTFNICLKTGVAPASSPADQVTLYSADISAGDANLLVRSESGAIFAFGGSLYSTVWFSGPSFGTAGNFMFRHLNGAALAIGPQINAPSGQVISFGVNDVVKMFATANGFNIGVSGIATGTNILRIDAGTAWTPAADASAIWTADLSAGNNGLFMVTEAGNTFAFGGMTVDTNFSVFHMDVATPDSVNYTLACNSTLTYLNGQTAVHLLANGAGPFFGVNAKGAVIGQTLVDTGANILKVELGTAWTSVADAWACYGADIVAGNTAPHFKSEAGDVIKLYKLSTGWSVTNGTTDRSYDADATSTPELADVLYTLIEDLKLSGLITS